MLYSQQGLTNVDGKSLDHRNHRDPGAEPGAHRAADSSKYPSPAERGEHRGTHDPIHIWLYINPRIFA